MDKTGKMNFIVFVIIAAGLAGAFFGYKSVVKTEDKLLKNENLNKMENIESQFVFMKTNKGEIKLELFTRDAPETVANFVKLSKNGFYDGIRFHRMIKGFMIQGGDPNSKDEDWSNDGTGGPGYTFEDEINSHKIVRGVLAMANAGPNTNGSQFFIVTAESAPWLDGRHTVFGKVVSGMETVDKIENVSTDKSRGDHPIENITIESITVLE